MKNAKKVFMMPDITHKEREHDRNFKISSSEKEKMEGREF